ncbi:LSU ribosomal protein L29p (L35e) [hydrothermal vent metagenome]|uniref:Large ribosomal subunit protein uL29 n=1 Tax=hydrothermal vent metagenome TaxID=652676 RepID=A0A3B0RIB7_9ZZZZ
MAKDKAGNTEDLRTKTDDQLETDLGDLKKEAFNLRFQAATNQLEKPSRMREVRRTIAKIKTLQNERAKAATADATSKAGA